MSSLDFDTDSTVIHNFEGSQFVETDQWDFEGMFGDKIQNGNSFGGILDPYHFEPWASDSEEEAVGV